MLVRLPANLRARTVSNKTRVALSCRNNQKPGNGVHSVSQTLPPLKDPIDGDSHTPRQRCFNARVCVNEVDRPGASRGENAKIVALREEGIERAEGVRPRIVSARNVRLRAEPRVKRDVRKAVTGFRSHCPGAYV